MFGPCKDGAKKIPLLSIAKFSKKNKMEVPIPNMVSKLVFTYTSFKFNLSLSLRINRLNESSC